VLTGSDARRRSRAPRPRVVPGARFGVLFVAVPRPRIDMGKWDMRDTRLAWVWLGLLTGCVADERVPLDQCTHGLYWADCGGDGEPLLGCDESTGACRWFSGGVAPRGHAVSDCPATDVCCHELWPFDDFRPDGELLRRVADQMGYITTPVSREDDDTVGVAFDLVDETTSGRIYNCSGSIPGCSLGNLGTPATVRREGSSVVVSMGGASRIEIEILPGTPWRARVYTVREPNPREFPPRLRCYDWSFGGSISPITGTLHLSSDDTTDVNALHGRLDAEGDTGSFSIEF